MTVPSFETPFVLLSNPLDLSHMENISLTFTVDPMPSYSKMLLTSRELTLLYPSQILVLPQFDRNPPKIWLTRHRQPPDVRQHLRGVKPLDQRLPELDLEASGSVIYPADPIILEESLQFSIESRVSPLWNRVRIRGIEEHLDRKLKMLTCTFNHEKLDK